MLQSWQSDGRVAKLLRTGTRHHKRQTSHSRMLYEPFYFSCPNNDLLSGRREFHQSFATLRYETGSAVGLSVAVGTVVTHCPPHRSVRAELPHTAPTSGHDAKPLRWVGMSQFYGRKVSVHYRSKTPPRHSYALTASP